MVDVDTPTVSVIVPVHDMADRVETAIRSALDQTAVCLEVIAVDDGSSDDSLQRIRVIRDPRLRICALEQNQGVAVARNCALQMARGEWIQFLDADDRLERDKLRLQLSAGGDADVIAGRWFEEEVNGRRRRFRPCFDFSGDPFPQILSGNPFPIHALLVRRSVVEAVGGFEPSVYHEDWDFWLKVAARGARFRYVDDSAVVYVIRPGSRSSDRRERISHELTYLDGLPTGSVPATKAAINAARRSRYFQLALYASMSGDAHALSYWCNLCGPLRRAESLELALMRSRFTSWLAGRLPGPRKLGRLIQGVFPRRTQ